MGKNSCSMDDLRVIADEVIDMLRPRGLTIADVRDVLKFVDENLEFEVLSDKAK